MEVIVSLDSYFANRLNNLKASISDFEKAKLDMNSGFDVYELTMKRKEKILAHLNATENDWNDYRWHLKNSFSNTKKLASYLKLSDEQFHEISTVEAQYRFSVSPYYMSLIDATNNNCPIKRLCIPSIDELDDDGVLDPLNERDTSLNCAITQRYPDRLIINVTNKCGTLCRHCQRKRLFGDNSTILSKSDALQSIDYIRTNNDIRDVLITGGDAFLLPDEYIQWILSELRGISHVEIIRFGTRTPVNLPQRITKNLIKIIKKYHPVYVNTQFNHPLEITPESKKACDMLADGGIPLGNQMVLLNKVNNDKFVVRKLNQQLLKIRVRPYYIFHPYHVKGTRHFWVNIQEGIDIMKSLRGFTSGMAVPYYVVNGPGGLGKTPILPEYMLCMDKDKAVFRNWEGKIFEVDNKGRERGDF